MTNELSIKSAPQQMGYAWGHVTVDVPNGTTISELLTPGFWAHHVDKLRPRDLVEVLSEDMGLDVQLRVIESFVGGVVMRLALKRHDYGKGKTVAVEETEDDKTPLPDAPEGYKVGWNIGSKTYYVESKLTRPPQLVSEGHASKREAIEAAIEHHDKVTTPLKAAWGPA